MNVRKTLQLLHLKLHPYFFHNVCAFRFTSEQFVTTNKWLSTVIILSTETTLEVKRTPQKILYSFPTPKHTKFPAKSNGHNVPTVYTLLYNYQATANQIIHNSNSTNN